MHPVGCIIRALHSHLHPLSRVIVLIGSADIRPFPHAVRETWCPTCCANVGVVTPSHTCRLLRCKQAGCMFLALVSSLFFSVPRCRWNMPTSSLLRSVVYDPIVDGRLVAAPHAPISVAPAADRSSKGGVAAGAVQVDTDVHPSSEHGARSRAPPGPATSQACSKPANGSGASELRKSLGVVTTFIVSGFAHEMILWYCDPSTNQGKWLLFFAVQVGGTKDGIKGMNDPVT